LHSVFKGAQIVVQFHQNVQWVEFQCLEQPTSQQSWTMKIVLMKFRRWPIRDGSRWRWWQRNFVRLNPLRSVKIARHKEPYTDRTKTRNCHLKWMHNDLPFVSTVLSN
jgi:hypothetical protein